MKSSGLKNLKIEHLRGSVVPFSISFEKGKKLTVIYGENATGKTTICDALEFLANGKVGSLEGRGLGNKTDRYWPSIGKKPSDVSVILESGGSSCTAKVVKGNVVASPAEERPRVEVLRRGQILRLLEAQPAGKYAEISRFIDVSGVEISENSLRSLIDGLRYDRDKAVAIVLENETAIRQFWESDGKPGQNYIAWAKKEIGRDQSENNAIIIALTKLQTSYHLLSTYPQKFEAAQAALKSAKAFHAEASKQFEGVLASSTEGANEVMEILSTAHSYFEHHPHPTQCPLCESSEKISSLDNRITERLKQFTDLKNISGKKADADKKMKEAEQNLATLLASFTEDRTNFQTILETEELEKGVKLPETTPPENLEELSAWVKATSHLPASWQEMGGRLQDHSKFIETLKKALKTYETNVNEQKRLDVLLPKLQRALEITIEERKNFTDEILEKIANEVGRLYEIVHPGEGLNKIKLQLDAMKRASLDIGASFAGQENTPPQAYFSQSHLDTLGLCIFLALSSMEEAAEIILVLDDVLASVDEPHVERLIEMLYAETIKFRHCVLTTHYRPWKQKLRWGWLQNGQCHFIELDQWTISEGLQLIQGIPDIERLRLLLEESPPDPQLVCSKAGVVLEAVLSFLTHLYECSVPLKLSTHYTIGDLLPAIDKKLRQALKIEILDVDATTGVSAYKEVSMAPFLDELTRIAQARNVFGAHFNTLSFDMLESDAIGFGQQVLELVEALVDPDSGWPKNPKSGSYWATANETRRLHPLRKPS